MQRLLLSWSRRTGTGSEVRDHGIQVQVETCDSDVFLTDGAGCSVPRRVLFWQSSTCAPAEDLELHSDVVAGRLQDTDDDVCFEAHKCSETRFMSRVRVQSDWSRGASYSRRGL